MIYFISIVHALTCVFIVLFVLLQDPKGGVLGSLGGGSRAFFGAEGASPFLVKVTKWLAVVFACSSFYLSYISSQKDKSVVTQELLSEEAMPAESPLSEEAAPTESQPSDKAAMPAESPLSDKPKSSPAGEEPLKTAPE